MNRCAALHDVGGFHARNDTNVGVKKVEANRYLANKIWNAGRFVISAIDGMQPEVNLRGELPPSPIHGF
ncbi:hypothetical protein [Candidatus Villigracilis affinis]|uniref:hypothetical protein n=1 Tax=Candidatus Villigracilis affinis TaxID=3140682 RepID=UPI001D61DE9E|nr:hypothetical protein [Anaerolineales bacterium]